MSTVKLLEYDDKGTPVAITRTYEGCVYCGKKGDVCPNREKHFAEVRARAAKFERTPKREKANRAYCAAKEFRSIREEY